MAIRIGLIGDHDPDVTAHQAEAFVRAAIRERTAAGRAPVFVRGP